MDKLSPELVSLIAGHLFSSPPPLWLPPPKAPFVPYACISRPWQYACETHSFASIRLKSGDLARFAEIFSKPRRRAILRQLHYDVALPTYGESRADHRANIAALTGAVHALLDLLSIWEEHVGAHEDTGRLEITLLVHVQEDIDSDIAAPTTTPLRWLRFADDVSLPSVGRITSLYTPLLGRPFHPEAMLKLAAAMPGLKKLSLEVIEPRLRMGKMRLAHRAAFAKGLAGLSLPKLEEMKIYQENNEPYNHSFQCEDVEENGVDRLNEALRIFTQSCPALKLIKLEHISVSPALFQDQSGQGGASAKGWPSLQKVHIIASLVAPSGRWYYSGDPNATEAGSRGISSDSDDSSTEDLSSKSSESYKSSEDSERPNTSMRNGVRPTHMWRTQPDPESFDPLAEALAGAVPRMPKLKHLEFEMAMWMGEEVGIMFECLEAGEGGHASSFRRYESENPTLRRWKICIGQATQWDVPLEVEARWREWLGPGGQILVGR